LNGPPKDGSRDDKWHAHVAIGRQQYLELRAWFSERALRDSATNLALAFYELPLGPSAPNANKKIRPVEEGQSLRRAYLGRWGRNFAEVLALYLAKGGMASWWRNIRAAFRQLRNAINGEEHHQPANVLHCQRQFMRTGQAIQRLAR